ncbi:type II toxin-antitoxin system Phd/YefM family antitoxin [Chachezhania sediminis]|uniref:type II toxin-antitoxin system Phd/YefM family antitoxin n=1 Tax=Chachezhania sediminis TaxID=2599291 RepID=UPI00131C1529|nr:type II toxin-antitoxin system Phd/YefM family antitoxin [Chachezhania sediminis]
MTRKGRYTISEARACLGQLCTRAQDPRDTIVLTRHGKPLAAIVSMEEVKRIWQLADYEETGFWNPLSGNRAKPPEHPRDLVYGLKGRLVTQREAALQMQEIQMTRATERRILKAGGLDPVEGGEIAVGSPKRWVQWVVDRFG